MPPYGKVALATGARRGIGRPLAAALAGSGAPTAAPYATRLMPLLDAIQAVRRA